MTSNAFAARTMNVAGQQLANEGVRVGSTSTTGLAWADRGDPIGLTVAQHLLAARSGLCLRGLLLSARLYAEHAARLRCSLSFFSAPRVGEPIA